MEQVNEAAKLVALAAESLSRYIELNSILEDSGLHDSRAMLDSALEKLVKCST